MSCKLCVLTFLVGVSLASASGAQNGPSFRFKEKQGPYPVGLKVVEQYDYSRTYRRATDALGKPYVGERARPIQTLVWYPASRGDSRSMTVGDYVNLWATETSFHHPKTSIRAKEWRSAMSATLTSPLWAVRDAPPTSGRFPVVIYAPGGSNMSWENADLCEYLASHGYVIVASPSVGATTRNMTTDLAGINTQARDILFLIDYAHTLSNTDMSHIAVAGHSWGGISNVFAAARDSRIDALVALDGSMRYYPDLVKQAGDVRPEHITTPLLYFTQRNFSIEDQERYSSEANRAGRSVLNAWTHGDLINVHLLGLSHPHFSSMYQRNEDMWWNLLHQWPMLQADYGREDAIEGYAWMARYTLWFLDAYLKHDAAAKTRLERAPAKNGVPQHLMAVVYRAAASDPASFDGFRAEIGLQGFDHAADIYAAIRKNRSDFELNEQELIDWADELIVDNLPTAAACLLELSLQLYPDSSATYESLGDAYRESGQKHLAAESYRKSIEKAPLNKGARERKLRELEAVRK